MEIPLWAQQKAIQGTVKDIEGNPMPGVTIMVDGTNIGTITNTDGKYSINIPEKRKSLTFSFLGYISQTLDIVGQQTINVVLKEDLMKIEEVVVIGYGQQKNLIYQEPLST